MHGLSDREQDLEFRQANRFEDNGQVSADIDQRLFRRGAIADQDVEGNGRVILPISRNLFRQKKGDKCLTAGNGDLPPAFTAEIGNLAEACPVSLKPRRIKSIYLRNFCDYPRKTAGPDLASSGQV